MKNSRIVKIIGIAIMTVLLGINGFGQINTPKNKNTENSPDKNLKGSSRINPSTLAMEFTLPFGLYAGRSGNGVPLSLSYSSKVWHRKSFPSMEVETVGGVSPITNIVNTSYNSMAKFSKRSISGWTSSMQVPAIIKDLEVYNQEGIYHPFYEPLDETPQININPSIDCRDTNNWSCHTEFAVTGGCLREFTVCSCFDTVAGQVNVHRDDGCVFSNGGGNGGPTPTPTPIFTVPTPTPQIQHIVPRLRVAMPDGSSVEFRKNDTVINCSTNQSACNGYQEGDYLAVNGSGMRLKIGDTSISNDPNIKNSVLYLPNGSRYVFPDLLLPNTSTLFLQSAYLIDVDGNKTTFDTTNKNWTDTMGKTLNDPLPNPLNLERATVGIKEFTLPGMSNPYKITWKKLKDETNPSNTVLEDTNKDLAYIGSDTCQSVLDDHPLSPALFSLPSGFTPGTGNPAFPNYQYQSKERFCGANPPIQDNGSQPTAQKFNPVVMSKVELPNGKFYEFKYNEYGEITQITYPTGVVEKFTYAQVTTVGSSGDDQTNRGVVERKVIADGVTQTWTYQISREASAPNIVKTTITAPDQSKTVSVMEENSASAGAFGFENPLAGATKETQTFGSDNRWVSRSLSKNIAETPTGSTIKRDPRPEISVSISFDRQADGVTYKALATMEEIEYDSNSDPTNFAHLNPKKTKGYHFLVISENDAKTQNVDWFINKFHTEGTLTGSTETDYVYDTPGYKAKGINSLPTESRVLDKSGAIISKTQTVFDESSYLVSDSGSLSGNAVGSWINPNTTLRGKPTTSKVWNNDTNTWIETHTQYDQYGNVRKVFDPLGNVAETEYSTEYKCAYPTKVITPAPDPDNSGHGTNQTSTTQTSYDFTTGLPLEVTDDFGQKIKTEYDQYLRPFRTSGVNVNVPITETYYDDEYLKWVKVRKQIDETNWDEATTYTDSLGRTIKTVAKDSQGDVIVETKYDNLGRVIATSNPYRNGDTVYWSKPRYDALNRVVETYAPEAGSPTDPNVHGASLGITEWGISTVQDFVGTYTIATDASGRKARSITNALGQLIRIDEPTSTTGNNDQDLGSLASPNQPTFYQYNPQGKMVHVQQGKAGEAAIQHRYFLYDYLGRLIRVRQPEQEVNTGTGGLDKNDPITGNNLWTAGFEYDVVGNLLVTTDAENKKIYNTYDKAGRVKTRSYSDTNTPTVNYYYDGYGLATPPPTTNNYFKGKVTKVTSSISETRYTEFDNFGRMLKSEQRTPFADENVVDAIPRVSSYKYDFGGRLIEQTYPSGKVVRNFFENDGDLTKIVRNGKVYASDFSYTPTSILEKVKLGNGLWESAKLNERQQVTEMNLGISPNDSSKWQLKYEYGELNQDGSVNIAKNTGNIAKQTLSFAGLANPFVQSFKYDAIDRITEARETSGTGANAPETWKQTYNYDRFGNRNSFSQTVNNQTLAINNQTLPSVNPNNNRFNDEQGFQYDKTGNIVQDIDKLTGLPRNFIFNGDNKQVHVKDSNNQTVGAYFYDGNGQRVKKVTNTDTTIFVYDAGGKLVAEYSTELNQNPTVSYTVTDKLGSPRVIVDKQGNIVSRRDFLPFGEEIGVDTPQITQRASIAQYNSQDTIRQKFTGYEKDKETRLDYAQARYYNSQYGRFTAVDPLLASGQSANPQTFNRYVYTMNRPLNHTDPTGLQTGDPVEPKNFRGQMHIVTTNGNNAYYDHPVTGSKPYNGNSVIAKDANGWRYKIVGGSNGSRTLIRGQIARDTTPKMAPAGIPLGVPKDSGFGEGTLEDIASNTKQYAVRALCAADETLRNAAYTLSPDYAKLSWSPGLFNIEGALSKDRRAYGGFGGLGNATEAQVNNSLGGDGAGDFLRNLRARAIPQFQVGYFTNGVDDEKQRHDAMQGTSISVTAQTPYFFSIGVDKSMPSEGGGLMNLLKEPTAIEIGTPGAGGDVTNSREFPSFSEWLRNKTARFSGCPTPQ